MIKMPKLPKINVSPRTKNIIEWGYCILIAIVLALLIRYYIGTPTIVRQPSMYPTLADGQRLILNRWVRTVGSELNRGDIITFEAPSRPDIPLDAVSWNEPVAIYDYEPRNVFGRFSYYVLEFGKKSYIKRVIALPGEHIRIEEGRVYIDGSLLDEPYLPRETFTEGGTFRDITVPEGHVFVMGDNREHSTDSRNFGAVPLDRVESRVWIRFWPFGGFGGVR
ncbi:MAG: signal peptidase I [Oscillospiraceae bacterium]|nr:signal peptidase I [Oscillospiraceae bacterium]